MQELWHLKKKNERAPVSLGLDANTPLRPHQRKWRPSFIFIAKRIVEIGRKEGRLTKKQALKSSAPLFFSHRSRRRAFPAFFLDLNAFSGGQTSF
jgi:hypothetical protein